MEISNMNAMHLAALNPPPGKPLEADVVESLEKAPNKTALAPPEEPKPWLDEPWGECIDSMSEYLSVQRTLACLSIEIMKMRYNALTDRLSSTHPQLANKSFNFTVNDQGNIEILGAQGSLTSEEIDYLSQLFNSDEEMKVHAQSVSEIARTLIKYEHPKSNIEDHENISVRLDFVKLLESKDTYTAFCDQVSAYTTPTGSVSHISERA